MITPVDIYDWHVTLRTYGSFVVIGLLFVGLIIYLAYSRVKHGWLWVECILKRQSQHLADSERVASEEHWKNCQVDKCPYLSKFFEELRDTRQIIEHFSGDAQTSRAETRTAIDTIMRRFDDFAVAMLSLSRKNGVNGGSR